MTSTTGSRPSGTTSSAGTRRQATRAKLLDAAYDLFFERGLHDVPIEQICERAGFTRGAFYSNFSSRNDVVAALYVRENEKLMDQLQDAIDVVLDRSTDALVEQIAGLFFSSTQENIAWFVLAAEARAAATRHPKELATITEAHEALLEKLTHTLEDAMSRAGRRLSIGYDDLALLLVSLGQAAVEESLMTGTPLTGTRYARLVPELIERYTVETGVPNDG